MDDPHHGDEYRERIKPLIDKHLEHDIRVLLLYTWSKHGPRASKFREPQDYPHEAILRTMDGRRPYDIEGPKTLIQHYQSVIDSLVSHDLDKARRNIAIVDYGEAEDGEPISGYDSSRIVANDHTEAEVIERVDAEKKNAALPADERQYEELHRLGLCKTAKDFSQHMNIPVNKVRNLEKRIARRKRRLNENQVI